MGRKNLAALGLVLWLCVPAFSQDGGGLGGGPVVSGYARGLTSGASDPAWVASEEGVAAYEASDEVDVYYPTGELVTQAVGPAITVEGTPEFVRATMENIDLLRATPVGRGTIAEIEATGRSVTIVYTDDQNGYAEALDRYNATVRPDGTPGEGSDVRVWFNPDFHVPAVVLGHEFLHAMHQAQGTLSLDPELQAIGLNEYEDDLLTENRLREELNALEGDLRQEQHLPHRASHSDPGQPVPRGLVETIERMGTEIDEQIVPTTSTTPPPPADAYGGAANRLNDLFGGE
jgi:hypothetical protein